MNAASFRHLFGYHFAENRKIFENYLPQLTKEQFQSEVDYSHGSVRGQLVHLISVDVVWFSDLSGVTISESFEPEDFPDADSLQARAQQVEQGIWGYLDTLTDEMLFEQPLGGEDQDLYVWQVLLQVVNHGTDHRAQILRLLNDLGVATSWQDYVFFAYGNPVADE